MAVEVALTRPERVDSLLLSAPGGSLFAEATPDLRAFIAAEDAALAHEDLDGAVEAELEPAALERLAEIRVPTLVLVGALDLQVVHDAARRVADGISGVRRIDWPGAAHLPSMERPHEFLALLRDWLTPRRAPD